MKNTKRGTNQFKDKYKYPLGLNQGAWLSLLYLAIFGLLVALWGISHKPKIISPLGDPIYAWTEPTPMPTPTPEPNKQNIVAYIMEVFGQENTAVAVKAIECFYSESGLRTDAYNWNPKDGSEDRGVAQINSIHGLEPDDAHDYKKNIDKAWEIYQRRGWSAWYGKGCK